MAVILRWLKRIAIGFVVFLLVAYAGLWLMFRYASVSTHGDVDLGVGNVVVPVERAHAWMAQSVVTDSLLVHWAAREIGDWQKEGKVSIPRILIGKLATGVDVDSVNTYLQAQKVRGTVGSTGPFHKTGDYDFTLAGLSLLLYAFGDQPDLLYPETVDHIVDVLMTQEGGTPKIYTPRLLGFPLRDTENHILMTEGSRYLKNRWKALHGNSDPKYDNVANGLEAWLVAYLEGMARAGFHEYNSRPYIGYTLTALLNLEAFTGEPVRVAARRVLDRANWEYAVGSLSLRRFSPFRRQARRSVDTDLDGDYHTGVMKAWMGLAGVDDLYIRKGEHQALWVPLTSYRPSDAVVAWIQEKPAPYFVKVGHGHDGSPEIYSGGPGYLITAGGVADDWAKQCVARPTTLMLEDGVMDLTGLLRIVGADSSYRAWNNTGVYKNFAVSAGAVIVPEGWVPVAQNDMWRIFERSGHFIAVYSTDMLGMFCLLPAGEINDLLKQLTEANGDGDVLQTRFQWPNGSTIVYDVRAPKDQWVLVSVDGKDVDRGFGVWPLMEGQVPGF
ncbi:MAG: hypothetical protein HOE48_24925 [Candidatus Latescibacteria bacterium]|nr:hypothetical protein [Candidatus Latescibacterota bacterium]MBT4141176.1 hypothetical protein [Candidatus Latescibacterota bacterium]